MSRWLLFLLFCLALPVQASCASPRGCPKHGGDAWREVNTAHFTLSTNLAKQEAHEFARTLEDSYRLLQFWVSRWLPINKAERDRIEIIHFATHEGLEDFTGAAAGFVSKRRGRLLTVTSDRRHQTATTEVLQHELTHRLMTDYVSKLPPWVTEGVAEFFSSVALRDDKAVAGNLTRRASFRWFHDDTGIPSIKKLRRFSKQGFGGKKASANYYAAWRAVHYFATTSTKLQLKFSGYVQLLSKGVPEQKAWVQAFGDTEAIHDRKVRAHDRMRYVPLLVLPRPPLPKAVVASRPLSEGETHALFAKVWNNSPNSNATRRERVANIEEELRLAVEHQPDFEDIAYLEFEYLEAKRRSVGALARLRAYVRKYPSNAKALRPLLYQEMERIPDDEKRIESLTKLLPLADSLAKVASTFDEYNQAAWYYSQMNMPEKGMGLAQRATIREPLCHYCLDTFALLLHQGGQLVLARIMQERAVALYRERGGVPPDVAGRLKQFREAAPGNSPTGTEESSGRPR